MELTKLTPEEEFEFQNWIRDLPWYGEFIDEYGEPPPLDTPMFDYRGAWKDGEVPLINEHDGRYHWGSKFKDKKHKTKYKDSFMKRYGYDPDDKKKNKGITKMQWLRMEHGR